MEFWLERSDKDMFRFPVNPTDFNISVSHKNTVVNVNALGDINLIGKTGLKECTLSSFFPAKEYNFSYNNNLKKPYDYVAKIEKWRNAGAPIILKITGTPIGNSEHTNKNEYYTIESFTYGEQDATGDVHFSLSLKEYKKINVKSDNDPNSSNRPIQDNKTNSGRSYTVKTGDTLWKIAKAMYGNGSKYPIIYKANTSVIKDPNTIYPKTVLKIP